MNAPVTYPIAEIFDSVQGEGTWTGTPMTFVRLAGCNVGKYTHANSRFSQCTTFDGFGFLCDTDYHASEKLTCEQILERAKLPRVCLTGGEPFMHDAKRLTASLMINEKYVHIETSGTKPIPQNFAAGEWITCCPKKGFLPINYYIPDEWKFLIENESQLLNVENFLHSDDTRPVFLQPINNVDTVNFATLKLTQKMLEYHPNWRLSVQLHKFLGVR